MKSKRGLIKLFTLPSIALVLLPLVALLADKTLSQGSPQLSVHNNTQGLEVANAEMLGKTVRLRLKNNYRKTIIAFAVSPPGNRRAHTLHILTGDEPDFAPGDTHDEILGFAPDQAEHEIGILAVVFADNTSDGDEAIVKEINDYRTGRRIQSSRIIPILDRLVAARDIELIAVAREVKTAIMELPSGSEQELPHFVLAGLRDSKEGILIKLQRLEEELLTEGNTRFREQLTKALVNLRRAAEEPRKERR